MLTTYGGWQYFLAKGARPVGLVLIQEVFGYNQYNEIVAKNLSAAGFTGRRPRVAVCARDAREKTVRFLSQLPE